MDAQRDVGERTEPPRSLADQGRLRELAEGFRDQGRLGHPCGIPGGRPFQQLVVDVEGRARHTMMLTDAFALRHPHRRSQQADPAGEELLHHAVLELAGLGELGFEGGEVGVHVGEDCGDGGLFSATGNGKRELHDI